MVTMIKHTSKRRAIQSALGHLGWHASGKDVKALLANYGVDATEGLVSKVKLESLKKSERVKRHEEKVKLAVKRQRRPRTQKKPQQRTSPPRWVEPAFVAKAIKFVNRLK